jgi:hypothetical protein
MKRDSVLGAQRTQAKPLGAQRKCENGWLRIVHKLRVRLIEGRQVKNKQFFFEKKNQKTFAC